VGWGGGEESEKDTKAGHKYEKSHIRRIITDMVMRGGECRRPIVPCYCGIAFNDRKLAFSILRRAILLTENHVIKPAGGGEKEIG